jgi:hypothetical protein
MKKARPNFNQAISTLIEHIARTMPEFAHIDAKRVLVVAGEARRASRGTVKPLAYDAAMHKRYRLPKVRVRGHRMLYCITLRPLFFRASTPSQRLGTLIHELFHISARFDGTLHKDRRHATMGKDFAKELRPLLRRYRRLCPAELRAPLAHDGEVRIWQWLERPSMLPNRANVRRLYTEDQLFQGVVRMISRPPRPSSVLKAPKRVTKLH